MKNIRVLDCTLRDGGRIINCDFPDSEIREISDKLAKAKIDIVELGFLRDWRNVSYIGNSTFFTDVDQMIPFINENRKNTLYVAFIDYGMFDFNSLKPYDGKSIDGIRFGFTKENYQKEKEEIINSAKAIQEKGYKLFIQGVNSLNYSDKEILELVEMVNIIHPYSFGIVDTYGAMYMDDVDRLYGLIDHNMDQDICINFHSHNNYQLSFSLAQEVIKLSHGSRSIIIDGTLGGMGKVAGNLNTELLVEYLVRKFHYDYETDDILDMLDDYIYKYSLKYKWGYSTSAMMAGIYKAHPNNVIYLTEKFRLDTKDIGKILSMIDSKNRQRYDYNNIEKLYIEYISDKVDDHETIDQLKKIIGDKEVLVLVPGMSLNSYRNVIDNYIKEETPFVISVNFIADYDDTYAFFGNQKRYNLLVKKRLSRKVIVSSNVKVDYFEKDNEEIREKEFVVNYHSLINRGYKYFENSTIMLLNLLKRMEVSKIQLAGFDGFEADKLTNYSDESFQNNRFIDHFGELNRDIFEMLKEYADTVRGKSTLNFLTPSIFQGAIEKCRI